MNIPTLTEVLIVALAFGIVGTYLMCWRHFLNQCEKDAVEPAKKPEPSASGTPVKARPAHA